MGEQDYLRRFLFEEHHVRGIWVHLDTSLRTILSHHPYPPVVSQFLGEALAASAMLASTIRFEGSLTLQCVTTHYLKLCLAQCTHDLHLRGLAHYQAEETSPTRQEIAASGNLIIAIDQKDLHHRHQGIVACHGKSLAYDLEQYFHQSEHLSTRMWLTANEKSASGLFLQKIPEEGETCPEVWRNIIALTETLTDEELQQESSITLLTKLYHEHQVRLFEPQIVSFRCQCSLSRMENALKTMTLEEAHAILSTSEHIDVNCEFCNSHFSFDKVDVERIFKAGMTGGEGSQH